MTPKKETLLTWIYRVVISAMITTGASYGCKSYNILVAMYYTGFDNAREIHKHEVRLDKVEATTLELTKDVTYLKAQREKP